MNDANLTVFVESVANYYQTVTSKPASVGSPFLTDNINKHLSDYTGIIGISGNHKGSVFFSAPSKMLTQLITSMGILTTQNDKLMDLAGEISNTIAGNARASFGEQFLLSVPVVIKGKIENVKITNVADIYVIPITWRHVKSTLIINLE